jgi:endonuclease III
MGGASASPTLTRYSPEFAGQLCSFVSRVAALPDVRAAVEANHDDNRWWPVYVRDWRVRMAVAGWSSRVSYAMVGTYASVVAHADKIGWGALTALTDESLHHIIQPIGLQAARIRYLRSLAHFLDRAEGPGTSVTAAPSDDLIASLAVSVAGAGYNTAQCAVLYARGYHCGVIPVDSGMVTKLAPTLGITLAPGVAGYEHLRKLLQRAVTAHAGVYRELAWSLNYRVTIPPGAAPTWFVHLVLIYFKRLYLNRPGPDLCLRRPACPTLLRCGCQPDGPRP